MFPLDLLPRPWSAILKVLPFQYMAYFPAVVFLGKVEGADLVYGLLGDLAWAVRSRPVAPAPSWACAATAPTEAEDGSAPTRRPIRRRGGIPQGSTLGSSIPAFQASNDDNRAFAGSERGLRDAGPDLGINRGMLSPY